MYIIYNCHIEICIKFEFDYINNNLFLVIFLLHSPTVPFSLLIAQRFQIIEKIKMRQTRNNVSEEFFVSVNFYPTRTLW